ncbi:fumarylacetoacetate hydrolase family protein [Heyndrickxia ginsengihumi]|uniref:Fumarylacetoacetate hydrolase n=1 Tax=Heyndrickxia ginsengihumi TaxID=363870 RepID=A0A0A6VC38_9BACI|nr:fumarylacetoacetate hydrolase family protein [Heyndrickxia ginsengihumi]KHD85068.1 fumarylacetoacetate hydrolase [Heyndrickxia ginsengihumi]MBE6183325.1 fumarylacetoacetate hydrolase [Bacillus sp. (in: firmicutes)]MCM3024113.1 fumarylacetoacetate hydrolase family protein [Heyndrickxia ginsengihumi]NEY21046.1 fumarylacetoacetate hydrolase [Heyndrickxia ginsengihumi]
MRIIRYVNDKGIPQLGAVTESQQIYDLPYKDILEVVEIAKLHHMTPSALVEEVINDSLPLEKSLEELRLLVPIEAQEVWAAGVTYEKSRDERNYESTGGQSDGPTFYDKVYDAERPEIFFKSTKERTVGPEQDVYLRSDSTWQIPEPELGLVVNGSGDILGYTVGNDMSSRDIEGENPLYLPQAKVWRHSCSIGPAIRLAETVADPYQIQIICRIYRGETLVFEDSANTNQLKRKFDELVRYLVKDNVVFDGTVLLTGTCIVPPNDFTLQDGDRIEIEIPGIGTLNNPVKSQVNEKLVK